MTNEKAAKIICSYLNNDTAIIEDGQVVSFTSVEVDEALQLAVRELRKGRNITSEDLVSTISHLELENERLHDRIEELKSVDSFMNKTGHWIVYMDDERYCCKCSECSKITSFRYMYCPNCGAKMEKEYEQRDN